MVTTKKKKCQSKDGCNEEAYRSGLCKFHYMERKDEIEPYDRPPIRI